MSENKVTLPEFYGVKAGMTRIFDENGNNVPVSVIKLIPNVISQVKTTEKEGYNSYQVAFYEKRANLLDKPIQGHLKKATITKNLCRFAEVRSNAVDSANLGKELAYDMFAKDVYVDVTATSKGKGFQGVMKRHNFAGGPGAHGSHFHRRAGSIGQRATPARVFPQKKMPGHMGCDTVTVQNLKIIEVNTDQGYMLIKGSIPGGKNGFVKIAKAHKKA
jgi:large subunit ribosomal protein L3